MLTVVAIIMYCITVCVQENVLWERIGDVLNIYQYLHCGKRSRAVSHNYVVSW